MSYLKAFRLYEGYLGKTQDWVLSAATKQAVAQTWQGTLLKP